MLSFAGFEWNRVELSLPGLPAELDGYQVAHLTDLHLSRLLQEPWAKAVVAATNAAEPDLIVISGDLVDGTTADRSADVAPLAQLSSERRESTLRNARVRHTDTSFCDAGQTVALTMLGALGGVILGHKLVNMYHLFFRFPQLEFLLSWPTLVAAVVASAVVTWSMNTALQKIT